MGPFDLYSSEYQGVVLFITMNCLQIATLMAVFVLVPAKNIGDRQFYDFSTEFPEMTTGGDEFEWTTDEYSTEPMSRQDRYSPEFSTELPEMTTGGDETEWTTDEYWTERNHMVTTKPYKQLVDLA